MEYVKFVLLLLFCINMFALSFASPTYDERTHDQSTHKASTHKANAYLTENTERERETSSHHRSKEQKIKDLRDKLDQTILRQEIQEIEIKNLKRDLKSTERLLWQLQEDSEDVLSAEASLVEVVGQLDEGRNHDSPSPWAKSKGSKPHSGVNLSSPGEVDRVSLEAHKELREDFLRLKAEMEALKSTCLDQSSQSNSKREESTLTWLLQVVPKLQQNVEDLQQSKNLLQELHDKKETDVKITSLVDELSSITQNLAKITAKVESTEAVAQMLNQEYAQTSSQLHQTQMNVAVIKEKLQEETETVDSLLKALPDGFLESKHSKRKPVEGNFENLKILEKIERLNSKTATLDFALLNLQKKVFVLSTPNQSEVAPATKPVQSDSRESEQSLLRLQAVEEQLSKMKNSSASLVKMLSEVEKFDDEVKDKLIENMAELGAKLEQEHGDRVAGETDSRTSRRELELEEHTDIFEFKRILSSFGERLKKLELKKEETVTSDTSSTRDTSSTHDTSGTIDSSKNDFASLQTRIGLTENRVSKLEENYLDVKSTKRRHHRKQHSHHKDEVS